MELALPTYLSTRGLVNLDNFPDIKDLQLVNDFREDLSYHNNILTLSFVRSFEMVAFTLLTDSPALLTDVSLPSKSGSNCAIFL